ncbi:MAG TPA: hypothetical protein VFV78_00510 [Vicinamibacterales bacterium]|nr:hypothetical protein [Vicinamibacterales bacterium]
MSERACRRVPNVLLAAAISAVALPAAAFAQCPKARADRPLFVAGGRYDAPLQGAATGGILIPLWDLEYGDAGCSAPAYRGLQVEATAGRGGARLAAGLARRTREDGHPSLFGQDVLVSVMRTGASPREADAHATYLGIEAGLTVLGVRLGLGVAHRLTSAGTKATVFTWSAGVQIGW